MAGAKNTQQSSRLVTLEPQTLLTVSILITVFYVEPNAGRSIDDLVANNLRVNEGESAVLPCFYSPSDAVIGKWYWKTNGTVIIRSDDPPNSYSRYSLGNAPSGNVSLVIKEVLRWDKGTYTCGVNDQSTGSTVPHADDSKLTVNYLDNPKIQALTDTSIPEGTQVSMSCKVVSSFPELNWLTWFHEGDVIDSASGKYIVNDEILEIKKIDQRDEGNYSCRAENEYFVGKNGKYSNSIIFSLKKEEAIPFSSSISQIWIMFIIIPVLICVAVLPIYLLKKRSKNIHRFDDFINNMVIKKDQKNEINTERTLADSITKAYLKREYPTTEKSDYEEALDFENDKAITVARGESIEVSFKSAYKSDHVCFEEVDRHRNLCSTPLLLSRARGENRLKTIYPLPPPNEESEYAKSGKYKVKDCHEQIEFMFELKGNIKNGAAAEGYLKCKYVTDDVEGQYVYLLRIIHERRQSGALPTIKHIFFGKTCIQLSNPIYGSNVDKRQFISPIGIVLNDQAYAFALKMEKDKEEQSENKTVLRYITCAGKPQSEDNNITITWNDFAQVLLKPEEELLSFVALPGLYHSYIFLGYINVSKDRRLLGKVFSFLPDGSFKLINNIVETLESEGPVEILKFDPHSGKKLSNGRLLVGGWIKRGYQKRTRMDVLKSRFTCCTSSISKLNDAENQSYEYEPFIMWTDDEINWNLGENLKIEKAEKNMRIQVTETGNGKRIVLIISSLDTNKVLYEGQSYDYCTTFTKITKDWNFKMPVVSFAIDKGSLVCASTMKTSVPKDGVTTAKKEEGSPENTRKENSPKTDWSMFGKLVSWVTYPLSYNSGESSTSKSTQKYKGVPTIEVSSTNNENSMENAMEEGSPETNTLSDDKEVIALEKPLESSMEGSSENIKKWLSLGKFAKKVKFPTKSKGKLSGSESAIQSESASLTEEFKLNKEESTDNTIKEDSSETNKQKDDEQITPTKEEPLEDSVEGSSEKLKKKKTGKKKPNKSKSESSGSKSTKEPQTSRMEVASNYDPSQIQGRSTWEGLWHLEQDTSSDTAIRLRPVKHDTGPSDKHEFVTVLENSSKVQCEQIVPFTCKNESWFLVIYKTHYINDKEGTQNHSLCTRYHVFTLDTIMGGK